MNIDKLYNALVDAEKKVIDADGEIAAAMAAAGIPEKMEALSELRTARSAAEDAYKQALLDAYKETGMKAPHIGGSIKVRTAYVYDKGAALEWAQKNNKKELVVSRVNARLFEKYCAIDELRPEFVDIVKELAPVVARKYLKGLANKPE